MTVHSLLMVLLVSVSCILLGPVKGTPVLMPISNERAENFVAGPPITFEELKSGISSKASGSQSNSFIPWEKQHPELVEGDVMPSGSKNAIIDSRGLWTNKIIPYVIDAAYTQDQRNIIATAMNEYHTKTCIRLVPRTTETNYIRIYKSGTGCWSYVGMLNRGMQEVSLDNGCMVNGIVIHELMHTVGFWHEHMRPDRDTYVRINLNNVLQREIYLYKIYLNLA